MVARKVESSKERTTGRNFTTMFTRGSNNKIIYLYISPKSLNNSKVQAVEDHIKCQKQVPQHLKDNLPLAQNRMK